MRRFQLFNPILYISAAAVRGKAGAKSTSSIVSVSFLPKDGVDAFELGEVASAVTVCFSPYLFEANSSFFVFPNRQNILAMAKDKLKFANVKSQFAPVGDIPVFSLLFVFNVDVCLLILTQLL